MRPRSAYAALLLLGTALLAMGGSDASSHAPRVAILDSGILASHSELASGQIVAWKDYVNGALVPYDDHGHGTAVASRAAGLTLGAYPGAALIVAKVLNSANLLPSCLALADSIRWATDQGADVISVSIWSSIPQPRCSTVDLVPAIGYATDRDVVVVWIAGNGGEEEILSSSDPGGPLGVPSPIPATTLMGANSPRTIVVGASDASGARASFSQRDPEVLAHGAGVACAWSDGGIYSDFRGTSFAAPWVAGAVARLLADGAPRDPDWLEWVLLHAARDDSSVPYVDEGYGYFGPAELAAARKVAQGSSPVPGPDERDVHHLATTAPRVAQTGHTPVGALPP